MNEGTGLFCQVTITQPQAALVAQAVGSVEGAPENVMNELGQLYEFFSFVAENPRAFPPKGSMAKSIKSRLRKL